ncbi:MAG: phosphoribosylamine--glycine ligase [Bacteroidota bacterium]
MNILVIGSGGREHALTWKLAQSPRCERVLISPGNAGTLEVGENIPIDVQNHESVYGLVQQEEVNLVVIGPEQPLVDGLADFLRERNVAVVGPGQAGAQLEGSKEFSKRFMQQHGIPTARYQSFDSDEIEAALSYVREQPLPVVVKASGLAAGKGVLICETHVAAETAVRDMLSGTSFGAAGTTVVIEEFLKGIEISIFVLTDGTSYKLLPSAKDYKRIGEGDTGLNTGGMGAVSPVPFATKGFLSEVEETIVKPTLAGLKAEGIPYQGFIFIGLMVVDGTPYVLEYNVRMGDPETEVVIPRLESDLVELFEGVVNGNLSEKELKLSPKTCTTIMLVSGGYPEAYEKGKLITGLEDVENSIIFHAGTRAERGQIFTNGGRVMALSSFGESIQHAIHYSLTNASRINFEGMNYRTDIGKDLIET